ncbi:hypothetical protein OHB26_35610 [Nocardia sp. NBC_01503]|uniref:hypothetical protein n=1 Tax=Nocardia sp. NBC_01503 TaxID=2975997 RepID=UPI002E7BFAB7|nr:hypothetical protein [Nocardia sp. NBC_01503]WTL32161.1 hypothetical protein OHB26_35610 [Nocardia sp. NBC_01503]
MHVLKEVGAIEDIIALADCLAADAALEIPNIVAWRLRALKEVGATEQITALAVSCWRK